MCSRFSLAEARDFLVVRLGVSAIALANYWPRYNIAPQQEHFIVTTESERRKVTAARWGLVINQEQGGRRVLINAKAETVESRPTFAEALALPASGFYEWRDQAMCGSPFGFAAETAICCFLLARIKMEKINDAGTASSFTILTCAANSTLATINDRMPVILSDRDADDWINLKWTQLSQQRSADLKVQILPGFN
jgi:putative SOS response-associated peptidase YedK